MGVIYFDFSMLSGVLSMFKNRYGIDKFNIFLLAISLPFTLSQYTFVISIILIIYSLYRCLSKDFAKRRAELYKFESIIQSFKMMTLKELKKIKNKFLYKIIKCPKCSQRLRIPRFKGYLIITCKTCKYKFKFKS